MIWRSCDSAVLTFTKLSPLETSYAPVCPETGGADWWMGRDLFSENTSSSILAGAGAGLSYNRPNNVHYKLRNWRPGPASPSASLNDLFVWKHQNNCGSIQYWEVKAWISICAATALSLIRLGQQVVQGPGINRIAYNASLLLNSSPPDSLIRQVTIIYRKTFLDFFTIELRDFLYFISLPSVSFLLKSFWTSLYLLSFTIWFLQTEENL